jgi:hypothetical protein
MNKNFTVVFIPNCYLHEDDSSDFKQWKDVDAKNSDEACKQFEGNSLIVRCYENK